METNEGDLPGPPVLDRTRVALFADLDGTLAPIEARPDDVGRDPRRSALVSRLLARLDGRFAVISGRDFATLDRLLEGKVPALGAEHGLLRRTAAGSRLTTAPHPGLEMAEQELLGFSSLHGGVLVEEKPHSLALHYRLAPALAEEAVDLAERTAARCGLQLQRGDMVIELRTPGPNKGAALTAFMRETPFSGAMPVYIGDDLTDEFAFGAAEAHGGFGVIVGSRRPTRARYALRDIDAAYAWMEGL